MMHIPVILVSFLLPTLLLLLTAAVVALRSAHDAARKMKGLNVPPGNMGWPFIGETVAFRKKHPSDELGQFMQERIRRYGKVFRSHIFGQPTIVSADPELNRYVLMNEGRLFEPSFPKSVRDIMGRTSLLVVTGELHRYLKQLSVNFMGIAMLRSNFLGDSEKYSLQALGSWRENVVFSAKDQAAKIAFNVMAKNIMSIDPDMHPEAKKLRLLYMAFTKGVTSFPLNIPGAAYRKALKSRSIILKTIEGMMKERIEMKAAGTDKIGESDLLGFMLEQSSLDTEQFGDLLLCMLFGGHETTSTAIALAMYFLHDCPKAVEQLRDEHLGIVRKKNARGEARALTWEDYRHMEFSQCVVNETLRLGNIIRFVHRKAVVDVQFKGYDIPCGWNVIPVFAAAHLDPDVYEDPHKFDPWRWQDITASTARNDNYVPFGQGLRKCAGLELAKMEVVVFIHHLVINFDWEVTEPDPPLTYAFPEFEKGLPIRVRRLALLD